MKYEFNLKALAALPSNEQQAYNQCHTSH